MTAYLLDDGTMDTVIVCGECGKQHRFNHEFTGETSGIDDCDNPEDIRAYEEFVLDCLADVTENCECEENND